jgi:hypothetical protein
MRPIFGLPTPKSGYGFPSAESPLRGLGEGKVFFHREDPQGALYRMWFNACLTT